MEFITLVLEHTYYWPLFYISPLLLVVLWFVLMILSVLWLYVDDRLGEVSPINKLFVFIEANCSVYRYENLVRAYNSGMRDRDDLGMMVLAVLFFSALGIYLFPLTIVILTVYGTIRGLRFLRRLQKRVTTISDIKKE